MLTRKNFSHILLNVASLCLPMVAAVAVLPGLLERLGTERFGLLSLTWALVGYFGMLDLGLGRALTQHLSQCSASGMPHANQAALACKARRIMLWIGTGWALLIMGLTPWLVTWFELSPVLQQEAWLVWPIVAISVPLFMWASCSVGVLEARSQFVAVNAVRVPLGLATFVVPWAVSHLTADLRLVMVGMLAVRLFGALAFAQVARPSFSAPSHTSPPGSLKALLHFGGWLTVSNMVGPFMVYFDRFAIGSMVSVSAVAIYTIPHDIVTRLPTVPVAMMGVLFPLLAQTSFQTPEIVRRLRGLVSAAAKLMALFWVPGMVAAFWLGPLLLNWWVGETVAKASEPIWCWLTVGVLLNGLAHLPFTLLQSSGRTDLIAKLHALELLPYCGLLAACLVQFGVVGAAIAWTLRVAVDTNVLYWMAIRRFPAAAKPLRNSLLLGVVASMVLIVTTLV